MDHTLKRWLSVAGDLGAPNLLPNPGFERARAADPLRPDSWIIDASGASSLVRSSLNPHTGRWALDAELHFSETGEGAVQLLTEAPVRVTPGQKLAVGGSFLRHETPGLDLEDARPSVWIAGRWLDTSSPAVAPDTRHRIVGSFLEFPGLGLPVSNYATRSATICAPVDADALIVVYILAGGNAVTPALLTIDDLFLRPVPDPTGRSTADEHQGRGRAPHNADRHRPVGRTTPDADRGPGHRAEHDGSQQCRLVLTESGAN